MLPASSGRRREPVAHRAYFDLVKTSAVGGSMNDTILVTGGAGFLGSHLCDRLVEQGRDVLCVDNLFTGSKQNIRHLLADDRFEFMRHDITFPLYVEIKRIFNLACPAS